MLDEHATFDTIVSNPSIFPADHTKIENKVDRLFCLAQSRINQYAGDIEQALVGLKGQQLDALVSIYELYLALLADPAEQDRLYQEHGIVADNRVRYPAQPLVKHLVKASFHQTHVKNRVTNWSAVIEAAVSSGISVEGFLSFIDESGGIDAIYRGMVKKSEGKQSMLEHARRLLHAKAAYSGQFPPAPMSSNEFTKGLSQGEHILIVSCDHEGNSEIVARVDTDTGRAGQMFDKQVLAWADANRVTEND